MLVFVICKDVFFLVKKKWIGFIFYEIKYELFLYVYFNYKIIDIFIENLIYVYVMLLYEVMYYFNNKKVYYKLFF